VQKPRHDLSLFQTFRYGTVQSRPIPGSPESAAAPTPQVSTPAGAGTAPHTSEESSSAQWTLSAQEVSESASVLQCVLLPSFQAASTGREQSVLQCVGTLQTSLIQLEKMVSCLNTDDQEAEPECADMACVQLY
jgi:hypothetical protein